MSAPNCCDHCGKPWVQRGNMLICPCGASATPRVARSLDDLKVGQVVAYPEDTGGEWRVHKIRDLDVWACDFPQRVVILSDPPPSPVTIDRALYERLREAVLSGYQVPLRDVSGEIVAAVESREDSNAVTTA